MWILSNVERPAYERLLANLETGAEVALIHQGNYYRIVRYAEPGHVRHELDGQQVAEYTSLETANQNFDRIAQQLQAMNADGGKLLGDKSAPTT